VKLLRGGHYDVKLAQEEWIKLVTWIDCGAPYYGSYFGRRNLQYQGQPDFRPVPTVDSACGIPPALALGKLPKGDPLPARLLGWWPLGDATPGAVADASGQGHQAKAVGAARSEGRNGRGARRFDGTGYVECRGLGMHEAVSLAMWVKADFLGSQWNPLLFSNDGRPGAVHFSLRSDGAPNVAVNTGQTSWTHRKARVDLRAGKWYHVALVCDARPGGSARFYVDGRGVGTLPLAAGRLLDLEAFRIGAYNGWERNPASNFHGEIDNVRVYSGMLSDQEVAQLSLPRCARPIMQSTVLSLSVLVALTGAAPPQHAGPPLARHAVTNRAFTGIPSMAVSPRGRLWATWYAGVTPGEDQNNYVVLSTSGDDGKTWKEVLTVDPDAGGPRRAFDPELWLAPDGKLRWFWADRTGGKPETDGLWMIALSGPDSEPAAWAPPVCVAHGVMMCKPLVLSSGEWVLPVCTWFTEQSSKMVVSTDAGKSWSIRGGATIPPAARTFDEHQFIERKDGSIWLLSRTKYGIGESLSADRGKTWPELTPSPLAHPSARFFVARLASGSLLLVKHGALDKRTGRSHLTAYISSDDGKTWGGGLLLDERRGVSYPDGQQTPDGLIRVIYDYNRTTDRQILIATFREEDAAAGKPLSTAVRLRQVVSTGSGGLAKPKPAGR
jgi:hypothetical protein